MPTDVASRTYTADELLALPDCDRYELLDGRLVPKATGAKAGYVAANIIGLVGVFVNEKGVDYLFSSDTGYILFPSKPNRVRFPDASFIRRGQLPNNAIPDGHFKVVPDAAVEVVSHNDGSCEVQEKVEEYLEAKVALVWVIYPRARVVLAFRPDGTVQRFTAADRLVAEDLFPGFSCRVEELFAVQ